MKKLPIALSSPHAGLDVPIALRDIWLLSADEVAADGDEGAREIYDGLADFVEVFVSTQIARAAVDLNRPETDRSKDGIIKTHTCWNAQIYRHTPSEELIQRLIKEHYHPYHKRLSEAASQGLKFGIDCHTMAAVAPPVAPDTGKKRPIICLSNLDGQSMSDEWLRRLADCFEDSFGCSISLNDPFHGGYIIRRHNKEMPWAQLELSRAPFASYVQKRQLILNALCRFCEQMKL
jgi:N-formylglutamate deformylase